MKRTGRRFKFGRIVRWAAVIGVLAVIALWVFRRPIVRRLVVPRLEQLLASELGLDVGIGDLDFDLSGRVTVTRFRATGSTPSTPVEGFVARRVVAKVSLPRLLGGDDGWFEEVEVDEPRVVVRVSGAHQQESEGVALQNGSGLGFRLPRLRLVGGKVVLRDGERTLSLERVSVRHDDGEVLVHVGVARGDWDVPRLSELEFPLRVRVHLQGQIFPWDRMAVSYLALGSRDMLRALEVDLATPGRVRISGDLEGWGIENVAVALEGDMAEVDATLRDVWAEDILRLIIDEPLPRCVVDGRIRLSVPLDRPEEARGQADLLLRGVSSTDPTFEVGSVALALRRADDGWIRGDVLAAAIRVADFPTVDLLGTWKAFWNPSVGLVVATDELRVLLDGVECCLAGEFRERDLEVRGGFFDLVASSLRGLEDLAPDLTDVRGRLTSTGSFRGRVLDEESWAASGSLTATDVRVSDSAPAVDVLAELGLLGCRLDLSRVDACAEDTELGLALSVDVGEPWIVEFRDIVGRVGPIAFLSIEPPVLELSEGSLSLPPTWIRGRRGDLHIEAHGRVPGGLSGYVIGENIEVPPLGGSNGSVLLVPGPVSLVAMFFPLEGPSREDDMLPDIDGSLVVSRGRLSAGMSRNKPFAFSTDFLLEGQTLKIRSVEGRTDSVQVSMKGVVPLKPLLEEGALPETARISLVGRVSDVGDLPVRPSGIRDLEGVVTIAASATAVVSPEVSDVVRSLDVLLNARLAGGTLKFSSDVPTIQDVAGSLTVSDGTLNIRGFSGRMRSSSFGLRGRASFGYPWDEGGARVRNVDVEVSSPNLMIAAGSGARIRGTVGLRWHGPWDATKLDGLLEVKRAYYVENISLAPSGGVSLPLELPSFEESPFAAMRLDLKVRSDHGMIVQNNLVSTRASADLTIGGSGRFPILTGYVTADEGTAFIGNSSIGIQNAVAEFSASDPLNARLRVSLGKNVRGYDVSVLISGSMSRPEVLLTSSPPLKRETIVLLIMTGFTPSEIDNRGAERVAATQAAMFLGRQMMSELSGPSDPTKESMMDNIVVETESAREQGQVDPLRVEYRIARDVPIDGAEVFIQGERDTYEDYNLSAGIRFELK